MLQFLYELYVLPLKVIFVIINTITTMLFFTSFVTLQQITNKNQPSSVYSTITNVVKNLSQWSSISLTGLNNGFYKVYIRLVAEYFYIFTIKCKIVLKIKLEFRYSWLILIKEGKLFRRTLSRQMKAYVQSFKEF